MDESKPRLLRPGIHAAGLRAPLRRYVRGQRRKGVADAR